MKTVKPLNRQAKVIAETYQDYPDPGYYFAFSDNDSMKPKVKRVIANSGAIKGIRFNCGNSGGVTFYRLDNE